MRTTFLMIGGVALTCILFVLPEGMAHAQTQGLAQIGRDAFASAGDRGLCAGDPLSSMFCNQDVPSMVNAAFQLAISAGAILALLRIVYSGYLYMGSADMWSTKSHAKEVFRDAIVGLLILLSIWLVLYQINPCILDLGVLKNGSASGNCSAAQQ